VFPSLRHLIEFAPAESRQPPLGAKCVLLRLRAVLFVEVARRYLDGLKGFTPLTEEV
jgi:hypothetical protein